MILDGLLGGGADGDAGRIAGVVAAADQGEGENDEGEQGLDGVQHGDFLRFVLSVRE